MAEDLTKITGTKEEIYEALLPQIKAIITDEPDEVANLGNICAALKEQFDWLWVGFYLVKRNIPNTEDELVLSAFQGPIACTRIKKGKGVCGTAWQNEETIIVPDVNAFPGHIACSSLSQSEIVIPIIKKGIVYGVLDIDSIALDTYDNTDKKYLEEIVSWL